MRRFPFLPSLFLAAAAVTGAVVGAQRAAKLNPLSRW